MMIFSITSQLYPAEIILDDITGLSGDTAIVAGQPVTFIFRATNLEPLNIVGFQIVSGVFPLMGLSGSHWRWILFL